jgi:glycosyltransferase involved in cell wall biosynthesis
VSIVVPAYNAAAYLGATLDSVIAQSLTDWEAVVVDDGSRDDTSAVARRYTEADSRIRLIRQPNGGLSAARMAGFAQTTPDSAFVIFLDSDDVWEPHALATLAAALDAAPAALGSHGLARFIDSRGERIRPGDAEAYGRDRKAVVGKRVVSLSPDQPTGFSTMTFHDPIFTAGLLLLRREAFERTGGFDVEDRLVEDWPVWIRLTSHGDLVFVDDVLLNYRRHAASLSGEYSRAMYVAAAQVRRRIARSPDLTPEQRHLARVATSLNGRYYARCRWQWVRENLSRGDLKLAATEAGRAILQELRASSPWLFALKVVPFLVANATWVFELEALPLPA